jgi:hypothetical protein
MTKDGKRKAIKNASKASLVPKLAATTRSLPIETSLVTNVKKAIRTVALKIFRFMEAFDHFSHWFLMPATQTLVLFI